MKLQTTMLADGSLKITGSSWAELNKHLSTLSGKEVLDLLRDAGWPQGTVSYRESILLADNKAWAAYCACTDVLIGDGDVFICARNLCHEFDVAIRWLSKAADRVKHMVFSKVSMATFDLGHAILHTAFVLKTKTIQDASIDDDYVMIEWARRCAEELEDIYQTFSEIDFYLEVTYNDDN